MGDAGRPAHKTTLETLPTRTTTNYVVDKRIGKGQFSIVYRARRISDGLVVAMKTVPIFDIQEPKSRADCIKEIDLLMSLDHPNIIRCHESFVEGNLLVIVLDLADAGDLQQLCRHYKSIGKHMPERVVLKYFVQMASALEHMHSHRIMHRDIKPANVFMTSAGIIKMGDLGLGRFFSTTTMEAHSLVGTPYYMSPERIHETGYSFSSDVWSMGCLVYELAVLHSPFYGERMTLQDLLRKVDAEACPPIASTHYSVGFRDLVRDMMRMDPEARPTAGQVLERAQALLAEVVASKPGPSTAGSNSAGGSAGPSRPATASAAAALLGQEGDASPPPPHPVPEAGAGSRD